MAGLATAALLVPALPAAATSNANGVFVGSATFSPGVPLGLLTPQSFAVTGQMAGTFIAVDLTLAVIAPGSFPCSFVGSVTGPPGVMTMNVNGGCGGTAANGVDMGMSCALTSNVASINIVLLVGSCGLVLDQPPTGGPTTSAVVTSTLLLDFTGQPGVPTTSYTVAGAFQAVGL